MLFDWGYKYQESNNISEIPIYQYLYSLQSQFSDPAQYLVLQSQPSLEGDTNPFPWNLFSLDMDRQLSYHIALIPLLICTKRTYQPEDLIENLLALCQLMEKHV
jgi:hypothetical protein